MDLTVKHIIDSGMTEKEAAVFMLSADLMNGFAKLPKLHQADCPDVVYHIHQIQNLLMSRPFYRKYRGYDGKS